MQAILKSTVYPDQGSSSGHSRNPALDAANQQDALQYLYIDIPPTSVHGYLHVVLTSSKYKKRLGVNPNMHVSLTIACKHDDYQ